MIARSLRLAALCVFVLPAAAQGRGDPGSVLSSLRLDDLRDPFERTLGERDDFGGGLAALGDIDGDGTIELAVGAPGDFTQRGAVWIFSLTNQRSVQRFVKLGPLESLPFVLDQGDRFGSAVTVIEDLDGDGIKELAVGAPGDDDGFAPPFGNGGAVYTLFLRRNGTLRTFTKLSRTNGFPVALDPGDSLGSAISLLGDLDGNGAADLAIGAAGDDDGGIGSGAVYVVFFASDRSILRVQKISRLEGGLTGLGNNSDFGSALALVGDLGNDGTPELAVGAPGARFDNGDCFLLGLKPDGTVRAQTLLLGPLALHGRYGGSLAALGDIDGNGAGDLAIGSPAASTVRIARLTPAATLLGEVALTVGVHAAVASPGDRNGDGRPDLFVGQPGADGIGGLYLNDLLQGGQAAGPGLLLRAANMGIAVAPRPLDGYGLGVAPIGDLDANGIAELAVSAPEDGFGSIWVHFLTGTSGARVTKLAAPAGLSRFGRHLARLGDLDGDGLPDLAATHQTGVAVLFLRANGTIRALNTFPLAGIEQLLAAGDLDGDGDGDLIARIGVTSIVFLYLARDGSLELARTLEESSVPGLGLEALQSAAFLGRAAGSGRLQLALLGLRLGDFKLYQLDLRGDGSVLGSQVRVHAARGDVELVTLGDLNGDGVNDLGQLAEGALLFLDFLDPTLRVLDTKLIGARNARFVFPLGDLTGDGVQDLAAQREVNPATPSHVLLFQLGGMATGGFETRDTAEQTPLENGRAFPVPHPGRTFRISSAGANLGAAVFDSTPGGPNDPSQDRDLLVGSGKVLMLQEPRAPTQSVPGIFDRPNDSSGGGSLAFDFPERVRPLSLELIDIDAGNEGATVTLVDDAGRRRTYVAPAGFTGDRLLDATSGLRVLRLDTLAPQPGFAASATASEQPGFAAERVLRIEVELSGSGALDDLIYDPYP